MTYSCTTRGLLLYQLFALHILLASSTAAVSDSKQQVRLAAGGEARLMRSASPDDTSLSISAVGEAAQPEAPARLSLAEISRSASFKAEDSSSMILERLPECAKSLFQKEARRLAHARIIEDAHPPQAGELHSNVAWPLKFPIYVVHAPELEVRRMALAAQLREAAKSSAGVHWVEGFGEEGEASDPAVLACFLGEEAAKATNGFRSRRKVSTALKHLFVYWHMLAKGTKEAIVLEDDVQPVSGWARALAKLQRDELPSLGDAASGSSALPAGEAYYDFVSLASCKPSVSPGGRARSELKYSRHLFAPTERFSPSCYSGYLVSEAGAAKFLQSRMQASQPRAEMSELTSSNELLVDIPWVQGSNPRLFRRVPLLFAKGQLGGSSLAVRAALGQAFQAPRAPNSVDIVHDILATKAGANYVINIGAGDGKGSSADSDPVYNIFKTFDLSGVVMEAEPQYASSLVQNLPSEKIKKVIGVQVTPINVAEMLDGVHAPKDPLYLKINVRGYDCALLQAVLTSGYQPHALHMQVNPEVPLPYAFGLHYDASFRSTKQAGGFYGCSVALADGLLRPHGYHPVAAGGTHEVVYVKSSLLAAAGGPFQEVPLSFVAAAVKSSLGSFSHFDKTPAGPAWRSVPWEAPVDAVNRAQHALLQSCEAVQAKDVQTEDAKSCAVPFTISTDAEEFAARAFGIAVRAARDKNGASPSWAEKGLLAALVQTTQSHIAPEAPHSLKYPTGTAYKQSFVKDASVKHVCEVGFGGGYSALSLLMAMPSTSTLTSFATGAEDYSRAAATLLQRAFPGQFVMVVGATNETLPQASRSSRCDVAVIDASSNVVTSLVDLANVRRLSKTNATVLMFDNSCSSTMCAVAAKVWEDALGAGWVQAFWSVDGVSAGRFQAPSKAFSILILFVVATLALGLAAGFLALELFGHGEASVPQPKILKQLSFFLDSQSQVLSDAPLAPRCPPTQASNENNAAGRDVML